MLSAYENWLKSYRAISDSSVKHYTGALNTISEKYNTNIFDITEINLFREFKNSVFMDSTFRDINARGNQMYSAALNHYERFLQKETNWVDIIIDSLISLNGKAGLNDIYVKVAELYPHLAVGTFSNTIRARIYEHSSDSQHFKGNTDLFYSDNKGSGIWGLRNYQYFRIAEEVEQKNLKEGSTKTITINAYERNPKARKECIDYYGAFCNVCGLDFSKCYGEKFEGLIHVHHLVPLSEIGSEYIVDPITDLRPVCPNCHLIIHRKPNSVYSIEEVQAMLNASK